jgi:putative membrane protein
MPAGRQSAIKHGTIPGMTLLLRLVVGAVALFISTLLISGITLLDDAFSGGWFGTLLLVALIFGVVNAILRPIIKTIGCAAYALTLGLVAVIVNGFLLWLTGWIAGELGIGFEVENFWPSAVLGALVIGLVSWLLNMFVKSR